MPASSDPSPTSAPSGGHEFGAAENEVIGRTARWVGWWGWIAIAAGVLLLVGGFMTLQDGGVAQLVVGGIYVLIGVYFRGAGSSLGRVVDTAGADVPHLMDALERLTAAFRVQVILVVVAVVLGIVGTVVTLTRQGVQVP